MNLFAVSFFGHRQVDDPFLIERQLESIIRELLLTKEYVEFLVGRDGEFDQLVSSTVRRCKDHESARCTSLTFVLFFSERKNMNKKKRISILFAVIIVVAVGIIIAVASHQKQEMDFDEFADRFKKSAEEVLGEDVRKVSKTELAATLTYGDQNDEDNNIYYRILKTTFYEGDPEEITGLHTEALGLLFPVDSMDSCEEMMIQDWPGALYKKDDTAFLCWTYSPEVTYVLEYTPSKLDDSEIIKMAESAEPVK